MPPADPEPPQEPAEEAGEDLGILCPNCAFGNVTDADFCARCGAPLSMMSTIDPLRSTLAEGFAYRQAVDGTSKPVVLVGIWLIFLPAMTLPLIGVIKEEHRTVFDLSRVILISLVSFVILYRTTANFLRKRRQARQVLAED